jgi:hypothetical protein
MLNNNIIISDNVMMAANASMISPMLKENRLVNLA